MAGVGVVIGFVSLAFVLSFVGAYFFSSFIDCLTRPSEERHRVHFESLQKMKEDVKKRVLDALFPAKKYEMGEVDAATEGSEAKPVEMEPCAICIEPFKAGDIVSEGRGCAHQYHRACILEWATKQNDCPVCRKALWNDDDYKNAKNNLFPSSLQPGGETTQIPTQAEIELQNVTQADTEHAV